MSLKPSLIAKTDAKANASQIFTVFDVRITLLTSRLIRVESGRSFTDLPSQVVWFRKFDAGQMKVVGTSEYLTVETKDVIFTVKKGKPYSVYDKQNGDTQIFSKQKNLKGTYRTLDMTSGKIPLKDGIITKNGAYLLDDSKSFLIDEGGRFVHRDKNTTDYYAFAYGRNYRSALQAFYKISSPTPMIPRFALGVWWSRYHAYTQQEYLDVIQDFKDNDVPLTVATVDMDWHWVKDIEKKFGVKYTGVSSSGWTGYSWNTELFPDYKGFLKKLKEDNLHITLNLHPADGVHSYEDMYADMAKAVGVNPDSKQKIDFKCGDDTFWNAYFDILHKPYEKDGVDFWWIDWQQGKSSDVRGLDPLCALNHYHFLDNAENGQMPLILSRYAGLGSHRYPLGFSGDTAMNWNVLDFQPYFTVNAANCAYTWWSHDIGGHHMGYRDDELYLRWIEFGVFSPILRLHSTSSQLLGKEPWKYRKDVCESAKEWLRFRHRLIPYIYTMDYRCHKEGIALCEPMYYSYPNDENAFSVANQYWFGSELIVCPITSKSSDKIYFSSVETWLPDGEYTDIFTLQKYKGNQKITLNRDIYSIPVLAKQGAILVLSNDEGNTVNNPESLEIWAFSGDNSFTLYEDNGKTNFEDNKVLTQFCIEKSNTVLRFEIKAPVGDRTLIPQDRTYKIVFRDIYGADVKCSTDFECYYDKNSSLAVCVGAADVDIIIELENVVYTSAKRYDYSQKIINILSRWQENTFYKNKVYKCFEGKTSKFQLLEANKKAPLPKEVKDLIFESLLEE